MNKETLKPFKSGSNAIENGIKGGLKSAEVRKQKKLFKEVVKDILDQKPSMKDLEELSKKYDLNTEEITLRTLLLDKQIQKALKGDSRSFTFLCKLSNEMPNEKELLETTIPIIRVDIVDSFDQVKPTSEEENK